ncbi:DUF2510 domain-containing protein [Microbacteriaceae bacterium VKM Ac-2854]|nr:DUF2510 domain-containing protein [Microbacteriaceae bacterium VKM Ac-2854]
MTELENADPGWYPDPTSPGRERWWSGTTWSKRSVKTPSGSTLNARFLRALRGASNTPAGVSIESGRWAIIFFLLITFARLLPSDTRDVAVLALLFAGTAATVCALIFGVAGLLQPRSSGGRPAAIIGTTIGGICGFFVVLLLALILLGG